MKHCTKPEDPQLKALSVMHERYRHTDRDDLATYRFTHEWICVIWAINMCKISERWHPWPHVVVESFIIQVWNRQSGNNGSICINQWRGAIDLHWISLQRQQFLGPEGLFEVPAARPSGVWQNFCQEICLKAICNSVHFSAFSQLKSCFF
jgi:hypothetical protein